MGQITTGVGLISGINTASLIDQLIAFEGRGKITLQRRISSLQAQQTAMLDINARLLNLKGAAEAFRLQDIFDSVTSTSSNESVLSATATAGAQVGAYTFVVDQLVANSQKMSSGFADRDSTAVGLSSISFEFGNGRLYNDTELGGINGALGVRRGKIEITDADSNTATIDLSSVATIDEVLDAINNNTSVDVTATVGGDGLIITDNTGGGGTLTIADSAGYFTATDLGIATADGGAGDGDSTADGVITGAQINRIGTAASMALLNDGNGVLVGNGLNVPDLHITTRDGVVHDIVLGQYDDGGGGDPQDAISTLQGVIDRISAISGGDVTAAIAADGVSLELTDNTGASASDFIVATSVTNSEAAGNLGILNAGVASSTISGSRILSEMNSVLVKNLNGGGGLNGATTATFTDRSGAAFTISNLDTFDSLDALIDAINADAVTNGVDITAGFNSTGSGLKITDTSGGGGNLIITGDGATALGIETDVAGVAASTVRGANAQLRYVSDSTSLSDLNYGRGIGTGSFRIVDANGEQAVVDITSSMKTLQDVIETINSKGLDINARINDTGDGLLIEDTSADGTLAIRIDNVSGTSAKDLGILGEAVDADANNFIDGSYEKTVALETTDTLDDVISKINAAEIPLNVNVLNTGTGPVPYRLTFSSEISGSVGDLIIDTGDETLGITTLTEATDARVFFGNSDPANAVLITSTSNSLNDVIEDVDITLTSASASPVTLTIGRDFTSINDAVKNLVTTFNDAIGRISDYDSYDSETEVKGPLLGDPTVARVRSALYRTLRSQATGVDTQYQFLSQIGLTIGNDDGTIKFDDAKFKAAYEADPVAVANLLAARDSTIEADEEIFEGITIQGTTETFNSLGVAEQFAELLDGFTNSIDGVMKTADDNYERLIDLTEDRIKAFDLRLEAKRERLQRQFIAMERALAQLQNQQGSLQSLANAAAFAAFQFARG